MEFRLLGAVAARVDGRDVDLGHARQRCVLAALLADANRVVPADQLLVRVWSHDHPRRGRNALSGYVSRLRQILGTTTIRRHPGGYVLTVEPDAVDLHRFRSLVSRARESTEDEAVALLGQALDLWHGPALATLDTPWVNALRERLDAERLAAELDRNDLALRLGFEVPPPTELADRYPLDERIAGQLMLALYRAGRQAQALRHYDRVRRALAEELGADPSPPLALTHQRILAADPTLTTAQASQPVPRQLPAPHGAFAGRVRVLRRLDEILENPGLTIAAVSGTAGVGKTALALHWAHGVADRFRDGQLYVDLRGFDPGSVTSPAEAVRGFLDALSVPPQRIPASLDAQLGLYRSLLAGRRLLVVLDNARDVDQVRPLLPGAAGCLVLVTSRDRLTSLVTREGAHPLPLGLLGDAEARALLARRAGQDRVDAEPAAVAEVVRRCARLPLALSVVAARAATDPTLGFAGLAAELRDHSGLDALAGADPLTDPRTVFSWSYRTLGQAAARLFRLLGAQLGAEVTEPAAASLAGLPVAEVRPALAELARAQLIAARSPRRFAVHDLLKAYAVELAATTEHDEATRRLRDHYLHTADAADRLLLPSRDPVHLPPPVAGVTLARLDDGAQAMAWFTAEHAVLVPLVDQTANDSPAHAWQLARALGTYLDRQAHWRDWATVGQAAVTATSTLADGPARAEAHRVLAYANAELGNYDEAHQQLREALTLFAGDAVGLARTHLAISWTHDRRSCPAEALAHGRTALDLYRSANVRSGQARALNIIGWSYAQLRDHRALAACRLAITLHHDLGDHYGEAASWDSLGYAHHHLGDHERAIACYTRAITLHHTAGDRHDEANVLAHLGDTHATAGDPDRAREAWSQALTILTDLDHPDADRLRATLNHA
ncbi:MAG TPA: BTAD domain-containing putative transcriptional regulator [Actinophytocola sp.]|nr:BTAD domain-containing putative transcriptional regulator [Actinophytocola sp.]